MTQLLPPRSAPILLLLAACAALGGCGAGPPAADGHVIQVTDKGFEPAVTEVKKGEAVTLLVTRRSDHTCATEMVFAGIDSSFDLPYHQTVRIRLAPNLGDTLRYACGMDMYSGMIVAK